MGEVENLAERKFHICIWNFCYSDGEIFSGNRISQSGISFEASIAEAPGLSRAQHGQLLFLQEPLLTSHAKRKEEGDFQYLFSLLRSW